MAGIITGVGVGIAMVVINALIHSVTGMRKRGRREAKLIQDNAQRIDVLEQRTADTKELLKLTLGTCIIIGDGMVQHGINGDFKKAFGEKKQDALRML